MTAAPNQVDRTLLPRWRTWRDALALGEVASVPTGPVISLPSLDRPAREWRSAGGAKHQAVELVAAALVTGSLAHPDAGRAANSLVTAPGVAPLQIAMARQYLGSPDRGSDRDDVGAGERAQRRIAILRGVVRREPRNAVRWVDLGREYLVLGLIERAGRCLRVALALRPDNRFILRSSVHLFAHVGDIPAAHRVLNRPVGEVDPWLLSTRIALSGGGGSLVRHARRMLADGHLPSWHAGELAGVLATLELSAGKSRDGRALLRRALINPTENVLAHAVWVAERGGVDVQIPMDGRPQRPYEALARTFERELRWSEASDAARQWLSDQPFALDAAVCGGLYALARDDFSLAADVASEGLRANREDPTLLNNRAFARANLGELGPACEDLMQLRKGDAGPICRCCAAATAGLVLFRSGAHAEGAGMYLRAIGNLQRLRRPELVARAAAHLASEEWRAGTGKEDEARGRARAAMARTQDPATLEVCERLLVGIGAGPPPLPPELPTRQAIAGLLPA